MMEKACSQVPHTNSDQLFWKTQLATRDTSVARVQSAQPARPGKEDLAGLRQLCYHAQGTIRKALLKESQRPRLPYMEGSILCV
jgi:hypothetical protein